MRHPSFKLTQMIIEQNFLDIMSNVPCTFTLFYLVAAKSKSVQTNLGLVASFVIFYLTQYTGDKSKKVNNHQNSNLLTHSHSSWHVCVDVASRTIKLTRMMNSLVDFRAMIAVLIHAIIHTYP